MSPPEIYIMSAPNSPSRVRRASRDTGFPDCFAGTSLPHPDADLSPNATISHDDLALGSALKRRRHSFLRKKRRTVSKSGSCITPQTEAIHSILSLGLITNVDARPDDGANSAASPVDSDGPRDSWQRSEDTPPTSPGTAGSDYAESKKRHGFFGKMMRR